MEVLTWASEQPLGIGCLILGVAAFARGWVVPQRTHQREIDRADRFEGMTLRLLQVADQSLGIAKGAVFQQADQ